ncbi:MAG: hypothetical protein DMG67_04020 [Acidobacteria bacterium]|nr:MAG: hypothetical protein DMG67_04020 [Acidobacteriota bacterium]
MRSAAGNRATHVTKNDIFRDVGFSPEKALALKFKARILVGILDEVKRKKYSQAQLVKVLPEHQPMLIAWACLWTFRSRVINHAVAGRHNGFRSILRSYQCADSSQCFFFFH